MSIMGLDIGYSNLKIYVGEVDDHKGMILPAGVMPSDSILDVGMGFNSFLEDTVKVTVDNESYFAGVAQEYIEGTSRVLSANYPSTIEYRALFHAALLLASTNKVEHLVTGLPVNEFMDKNKVKRLKDMLTGEHTVTAKRSIEVEKVSIVPQPIGGYVTAHRKMPEIENMDILVIDPGFYSVDWVVLRQAKFQRETLGSSMRAMSVLIEQASNLIFTDYGGHESVERIETAIREGKETVYLYGEKIDIKHYLHKASETVGAEVMRNVNASLRNAKSGIDAVLLVGGGASFFKEAAQDCFPKSKFIEPDNSVLGNAEGFWLMGCES